MTERQSLHPIAPLTATRLGLAVSSSLLATALTVVLMPFLAMNVFLLFLIAVLVSSLRGGLWTGLVAGGLSVLGVMMFVFPPAGTPLLSSGVDIGRTAAFGAMTVVTALLSQALISARHRSEARAQEALVGEESFRELFNNIADAVYVYGPTGRVLNLNEAAAALHGVPREQLLGRTWDSLADTDANDMEAIRDALERAFAGKPQSLEAWVRHEDGRSIPVEAKITAARYFGRDVVLAVARDLSERHRLEEQLRHSQKMDAIGRLAGGVAHDFNNLLTSIRGYASLMRDRVAHDRSLIEDLDEIERAVDLAAAVTGGKVRVDGLGLDSSQGDLRFVDVGPCRNLVEHDGRPSLCVVHRRQAVSPKGLARAGLVDVERVDAPSGELVTHARPHQHLLRAVETVDEHHRGTRPVAAVGAPEPAGDHAVEVRRVESFDRLATELDSPTERLLSLLEHGEPLGAAMGLHAFGRLVVERRAMQLRGRREPTAELLVFVRQLDQLVGLSDPRREVLLGARVLPALRRLAQGRAHLVDLADLEALTKRLDRVGRMARVGQKDAIAPAEALQKAVTAVEKGTPLDRWVAEGRVEMPDEERYLELLAQYNRNTLEVTAVDVPDVIAELRDERPSVPAAACPRVVFAAVDAPAPRTVPGARAAHGFTVITDDGAGVAAGVGARLRTAFRMSSTASGIPFI